MGILDKDDGECWATRRLRDSEVATTLIDLSLCSPAPTSGPRRLVGVDRSGSGVLMMATEISLKEVVEMAREIGVTKAVGECSENVRPGPTGDVGAGLA